MPSTLNSNLRQTLEAIEAAEKSAGRAPDGVQLLAVTKSVGPELAFALARLGQRDLGENRLPQLEAKREHFQAQDPEGKFPVTWHYIGHIQRNKARRVLQHSNVLHSVDTTQLILTLERIAAEENRLVRLYLEVKLDTEAEKHGFPVADVAAAIQAVGDCPHLQLLGLMTMASHPSRATRSAREQFDEMAQLAHEYENDSALKEHFEGGRVRLSMGMSGDFADAIAAGSDVVRIGSALFHGLPHELPHELPGDLPQDLPRDASSPEVKS